MSETCRFPLDRLGGDYAYAEPVTEARPGGNALVCGGPVISDGDCLIHIGVPRYGLDERAWEQASAIIWARKQAQDDIAGLLAGLESRRNRDKNIRLQEERRQAVEEFLAGEDIDLARLDDSLFDLCYPYGDRHLPDHAIIRLYDYLLGADLGDENPEHLRAYLIQFLGDRPESFVRAVLADPSEYVVAAAVSGCAVPHDVPLLISLMERSDFVRMSLCANPYLGSESVLFLIRYAHQMGSEARSQACRALIHHDAAPDDLTIEVVNSDTLSRDSLIALARNRTRLPETVLARLEADSRKTVRAAASSHRRRAQRAAPNAPGPPTGDHSA